MVILLPIQRLLSSRIHGPAVTLLIAILWSWSLPANASDAVPHYKPSSRSPEALDITTNSYGFSRTAPRALELGVTVGDFVLPRSGGGATSLETARQEGPVVIIFYRGHW
jgi:hypothetical protein